MTTFWITTYILVWPIVAAGVLAVLLRAMVRDAREARREGTELV